MIVITGYPDSEVLDRILQISPVTVLKKPLKIEQLNQTWTCLVTLRALPFLFARHPEVEGFRLCLGAAGGTDIESVAPDAVAAEVFAAVHPRNNRKLLKDLQRLACRHPRTHARYVFLGTLSFRHERQFALETVVRIDV